MFVSIDMAPALNAGFGSFVIVIITANSFPSRYFICSGFNLQKSIRKYPRDPKPNQLTGHRRTFLKNSPHVSLHASGQSTLLDHHSSKTEYQIFSICPTTLHPFGGRVEIGLNHYSQHSSNSTPATNSGPTKKPLIYAIWHLIQVHQYSTLLNPSTKLLCST